MKATYNGSEYVYKAETTANARPNDTKSATYHNGKEWVNRIDLGGESGGGGDVIWADIQNKPSSYPPEDHTHSGYSETGHGHSIGDVSGLQGALDSKASSSHSHDGTYAPVGHTHASAITPIADPTTATVEDVANKVNELITALQGG